MTTGFVARYGLHLCLLQLSVLHCLVANALFSLQDETYAVWQRMIKASVVPDEITQRLLAVAFGNNPTMANALVRDARRMQVGPVANVQGHQ